MFVPVLLAGAVFALDQVSKALVVRGYGQGASIAARIVYVRPVFNRGHGTRRRVGAAAHVVAGCALLTAAVLLSLDVEWSSRAAGLSGLWAAIGGAAGNMADRLRHGAVIDFIDLGWWPVFNLADAAIVAGTAMMVLSVAGL